MTNEELELESALKLALKLAIERRDECVQKLDSLTSHTFAVAREIKEAHENLSSVQAECGRLQATARGSKIAIKRFLADEISKIELKGLPIDEILGDHKLVWTGLLEPLYEFAVERGRQDLKWGALSEKDFKLPDGTGLAYDTHAEDAKRSCQSAAKDGTLTWRHILVEEVMEALAESDEDALYAELVQVGAVCAKWMEAIKVRQSRSHRPTTDSTDVVIYNGRPFKRGKCENDSRCFACERLGYHLEPV